MELIQNWDIENRKLLFDFIKNQIYDCDYKDITIVGSRIFGGFNPKSDIDVIVWLEDFNESKNNIHCYFDSIENPENPYNNFRVCIFFRDYKGFKKNNWISAGYEYEFPKYSIVTDTYYNGKLNHIKHHQRLRKLIKDCNGINVPFKKFEQENNYLLKEK